MDTSAAALDRARDGIAASLQRAVGKKKLAADAAQASLARIAPHREMEVHTPGLKLTNSLGRASDEPDEHNRGLDEATVCPWTLPLQSLPSLSAGVTM